MTKKIASLLVLLTLSMVLPACKVSFKLKFGAHRYMPNERRPDCFYEPGPDRVLNCDKVHGKRKHYAQVMEVSEAYNISTNAANSLVRAAKLGEKGDLTGIKALGLDRGDLKDLSKGRKLSQDKIESFAHRLQMTPLDAEILLDELVETVKVQ